MAKKIKIKRGDSFSTTITIPLSIYQPGSTLYFMAKETPDNDFGDTKAVFSKSVSDGGAIVGDEAVFYNLSLTPAETSNVEFSTVENKKELLAEFEYRTPNGEVYSFPDDDKYIEVIVYADIRRGGGR